MKPQNEMVDNILNRANAAAAEFNQLDQQQTDRIVRAVYEAALEHRVDLAKHAYEETGMGRWEDKVIKNTVGSLLVYQSICNLKTVGVISHDEENGLSEIALPIGPILAIIPCTNPTSTVMFKVLIALKTRNPIIISAHHRAMECCRETVDILYRAALSANAPEDCILFFERASREDTQALMSDKRLALILATGGEGVVRAAYSSGIPALGVGAGNVPVFIENSADPAFAAEQIILSKTFDNGTICASEQALVVQKELAPALLDELRKHGAHILSPEETEKVAAIAFDKAKQAMTADIVGQSALKIATMAGIQVPGNTRLLIAPTKGVGSENPLSYEILCPLLAFYTVDSFDDGISLCIDLNFHGGIGHTAVIYSNDEEKIKTFSLTMNAGRILVNTPSSQGAVGGIFNRLMPSFTLGCGTGGKNITMDNITATHLLNIQRLARRRNNERLARFDTTKLFDTTLSASTIEQEFNKNR